MESRTVDVTFADGEEIQRLDQTNAPVVDDNRYRAFALNLFERFESYVLGMIEIMRCILFELQFEHTLAYGGALVFTIYILISGWFIELRWASWLFFATAFGLTVGHTMMMSVNARLFDRMRITRHWNCSNSFMLLASWQIFWLELRSDETSKLSRLYFAIDSSVARYLNLTLLLKITVFCRSVLVQYEAKAQRKRARRGSVTSTTGGTPKETFRTHPFYLLILGSVVASVTEGVVLDLDPFESATFTALVIAGLHLFATLSHMIIAHACCRAVLRTRPYLNGVILNGARFVALFGTIHAVFVEATAAALMWPPLQDLGALDTALSYLLLFFSERHERAFWDEFSVSTKTGTSKTSRRTKGSQPYTHYTTTRTSTGGTMAGTGQAGAGVGPMYSARFSSAGTAGDVTSPIAVELEERSMSDLHAQ